MVSCTQTRLRIADIVSEENIFGGFNIQIDWQCINDDCDVRVTTVTPASLAAPTH